MTAQTAMFLVYAGLQLHVLLFFGTSALSVPTASEIEQLKEVETGRKREVKYSSKSETADEGLKGVRSVEDLSTRHENDGFGLHYGDIGHGEEITGHTKSKARSSQEGTRNKRLAKLHESEGIRHTENREAILRRHSLHKREAMSKKSSRLSIGQSLSILTDMVREYEHNRQLAEEDVMRQKLYDLGKRSDDTAARNSPNSIHEDRDLVNLLQRAFSSSETN